MDLERDLISQLRKRNPKWSPMQLEAGYENELGKHMRREKRASYL